ncbi:hypothetical protein GQ54DRAFT_67295 [Martensiomyces pterosporus]|nr:hypothetical protein GQ54DRAFT_67295 [Martensiomyces pterosporus]
MSALCTPVHRCSCWPSFSQAQSGSIRSLFWRADQGCYCFICCMESMEGRSLSFRLNKPSGFYATAPFILFPPSPAFFLLGAAFSIPLGAVVDTIIIIFLCVGRWEWCINTGAFEARQRPLESTTAFSGVPGGRGYMIVRTHCACALVRALSVRE